MLVVVFILLIPLVAMQFTDEVVWTLSDFAIAGFFLFGAGLTYEFIARKGSNTAYRTAVGVAVATALLLVWVNGAVGLIGSEDNPINLLYFGVLAVGIIGVIIARFRSRGMMSVLFLTAIAQALVAVIALIAGEHQSPVSSVSEIVIVNGFFIALWLGSALLFRRVNTTGSKLKKILQSNVTTSNIISWSFGIVFVVIGVLNMFLVHFVPGAFYILLSIIYIPQTNAFIKKKFGFSIPFAVKIIVGLVILWGTLAVGDLAEIFGL